MSGIHTKLFDGGANITFYNSEGGYGINIQVEKSKNMTIVNFTEHDLNQLFLIFECDRFGNQSIKFHFM